MKNINNKLRNFLDERTKTMGRNPAQSIELITKHHQRVLNAYIENESGEKIYSNYDKSFDELTDNYGRNKPTIESISSRTKGYVASLISTDIIIKCNNKEQLTYLFNNFQTIGSKIKICFGWNNIQSFKQPDNVDEFLNKINEFSVKSMTEEVEKETILSKPLFSDDSEVYYLEGIVSNFSQQSTENGGFSVSMAITTANESFLNLGKEFVANSFNSSLILSELFDNKYRLDWVGEVGVVKYYRLGDFIDIVNKLDDDNFSITMFDIETEIDNETKISDAKFPYYFHPKFPYISLYPKYVYFMSEYQISMWGAENLIKKDKLNLIKNILISEDLISESFEMGETMLNIFKIILDKINSSTDNLTNIKINNIMESNYNISNNAILKNKISNEYKFSLHNHNSITKSMNLSSKIDDIQRALYVMDILGIKQKTENSKKPFKNMNTLEYIFNINKSDENYQLFIYSMLGIKTDGLIRHFGKNVVAEVGYDKFSYARMMGKPFNNNEDFSIDFIKMIRDKMTNMFQKSYDKGVNKIWTYKSKIINKLRWDITETEININNVFKGISFFDYLKCIFKYFKNHGDGEGITFSEDNLTVTIANRDYEERVSKKFYGFESSITIDGVNGFHYGDVVSFDYLDNLFKKEGLTPLFMIKEISHNVSVSSWETTLSFIFIPMST